jgi:hypothetical protein
MLLKHNLRVEAREMNIVPGLHSALVSTPKLADVGYTTVFNKKEAAIYDDYTTKITATSPPVLESERCENTGIWKLDLNPAATLTTPTDPAAPLETINVIFELPSARDTFLWIMHLRASQQKQRSSTPSATETTPHGRNLL